ncbi:MAG TPA: Zn-dependent hydrolase [Leptolyngbyaceae cyanobacterium M65_K2018_010]|nr:Zn-dependent hydrolase [Leptolyngbyaceae cyanobacterium M65_K2018_010]
MTLLQTLYVNGKRLNQSIDDLAQIGQLANGGICRLAFSAEDLQGRELVRRWMVEAGLEVRIDTAGNMIGRLPGKLKLPALATGSHIDTVPCGGKFDGNLGVLAGLEVVRTLQEKGVTLNHPLEVIVFADEEDTMIGSRAMAGTASLNAADYHRKDGRPMDECVNQVGGNWLQLAQARRTRQDICAFVELHVEQGGVLETAGRQIGVVQGVVGMQRYRIDITGRPNHAGTTPMDQRQDALVAAARVVLAVNRLATQPPGDRVATVGALQVSPNAANIVPGRVEASLDVRDLDQAVIDDLVGNLRAEMAAIAEATHTHIELVPQLNVAPSPAAPHIQATIAEVSAGLGLSSMSMPSRAGHDALEMGRFTDMGMIFVPSEGGWSHSEVEYTTPEECTQGANVLLETLLRLDRHYS